MIKKQATPLLLPYPFINLSYPQTLPQKMGINANKKIEFKKKRKTVLFSPLPDLGKGGRKVFLKLRP